MSDGDTVPVSISIGEITPCRGSGKLVATATVLLAVHDIEILIAGCQIRLTDDGRQYRVQSPQHRDPNSGMWLPSIILPPELSTALGGQLLDAWEHDLKARVA